ncbi:MAG: PIN domain-containing protein [Nanoarchaeota archaeon]
MKFVVDTNIILSALIKDSLSREILTNFKFDFFTSSFALSEITKYREYVCKKASLTEEQFNSILKKIFEYIEVVNSDSYHNSIAEASVLIEDTKDIPFLACAIFLGANILSEDRHFNKQSKVKVFGVNEFVKTFLKN